MTTDAAAVAETGWVLGVGDHGQRVADMQWLLSGHNRYGIQTYRGKIDGDFGAATGKAAHDMKWQIGYPDEACVPTAGSTLRSYLIPKTADEAQLRTPAMVARANSRKPTTSYPLAEPGVLIGWPYQGTHTRGNWESDRAVDIACPKGTEVLACFAGVIGTQFGPLSSHDPHLLGLRFHIVGATDEAYYAHLSAFSPGIKPGVRVQPGQVCGLSGVANGVAHLHFALEHGYPPTFIEQQLV